MGVSVVRCLGPRLPYPAAHAGGSRLWQTATGSDPARELPAPQRPNPRLRMELRRRQSAGPSMGDNFHLPPGEGANRQRRPDMAGTQFSETLVELHLVA